MQKLYPTTLFFRLPPRDPHGPRPIKRWRRVPLLRTQPASRVSGPGFKIGVAGGVDVPPNLKGGGQGKLPAGGGGGHRAVERRWREPRSRAVEDDRWVVEAAGSAGAGGGGGRGGDGSAKVSGGSGGGRRRRWREPPESREAPAAGARRRPGKAGRRGRALASSPKWHRHPTGHCQCCCCCHQETLFLACPKTMSSSYSYSHR